MGNKVFIGGLCYDTTEKGLYDKLSEFGQVKSIRIVTHKETGKSRGFGFATFENEEQAKACIENMNNSVFDGRRIGVKESIERP